MVHQPKLALDVVSLVELDWVGELAVHLTLVDGVVQEM